MVDAIPPFEVKMKNIGRDIPSLRISSNPVRKGERIQLSMFNAGGGSIELELADSEGKVVYTTTLSAEEIILHKIDTSSLKAGSYLLTLIGDSINTHKHISLQDHEEA